MIGLRRCSHVHTALHQPYLPSIYILPHKLHQKYNAVCVRKFTRSTLVDTITLPEIVPHSARAKINAIGVKKGKKEMAEKSKKELVIANLYRTNRYEHAVQAFIQLKASGVKPSKESYETIIRICEKRGDVYAAEQLCHDFSSRTSTVALDSLLRLHLMNADFESATEVLVSRQNLGLLTPGHFNAIMEAGLEHHASMQSFKALALMDTLNVAPDRRSWMLQFKAARAMPPPRTSYFTKSIWDKFKNSPTEKYDPLIFTAYLRALLFTGDRGQATIDLMAELRDKLTTNFDDLKDTPHNKPLALPEQDTEFIARLGPFALRTVLDGMCLQRPLRECTVKDAYVLAKLGQTVFNTSPHTAAATAGERPLTHHVGAIGGVIGGVGRVEKAGNAEKPVYDPGLFFQACVHVSASLFREENGHLVKDISSRKIVPPHFRYFAETDWWLHRPADSSSTHLTTMTALLRFTRRARVYQQRLPLAQTVLSSQRLEEMADHALNIQSLDNHHSSMFWSNLLFAHNLSASHGLQGVSSPSNISDSQSIDDILSDGVATQDRLRENAARKGSAGLIAMLNQVKWLNGDTPSTEDVIQSQSTDGRVRTNPHTQPLIGIKALSHQYAILMGATCALSRSALSDESVRRVEAFVQRSMEPTTVHMPLIYSNYLKLLSHDAVQKDDLVLEIYRSHKKSPLWHPSSNVTCLRSVIKSCARLCRTNKKYAVIAIKDVYPALKNSPGHLGLDYSSVDALTAYYAIICARTLKMDETVISIYSAVPARQQVDPALLNHVLKVVAKRPNVEATLSWLLPRSNTLSVKSALALFYARYQFDDPLPLIDEVRREAAIGSARDKRRFNLWQTRLIKAFLTIDRPEAAVEQLEWYGTHCGDYGGRLTTELFEQTCAVLPDDSPLLDRVLVIMDLCPPVESQGYIGGLGAGTKPTVKGTKHRKQQNRSKRTSQEHSSVLSRKKSDIKSMVD